MHSIYKIIHTTCHTQWGGLEKRIFNESVWMQEKGHTVIIVAPEDTPLFKKAKDYGFKVYPVDFKFFSTFKNYQELKRIFSNEQPDIVNTHGNKDSKLALPAAKKTGVKLRILSRHISAHVSNTWYNRKLYKKFSHYVFTTADYTTRHLKNVFKLKDMKVFSMPSGINVPDSLQDREDARKELAEHLKLDETTRFIGFVGRVSKDKGVSYLLEAFSLIKTGLPTHHLVIVGDGTDDYLNQLKQIAKNLKIENQIHFVGFTSNVWPYYLAFDCKVLPSVNIKGIPFEGIPQSLLEAMACECPVVGARTGGISDIIVDHETGLLFEPENPGDIAEKIMLTLDNPDETLEQTQRAVKDVMKNHTIDAMGRDIIRIYRLHDIRLDRSSPYLAHL